jgi:CubicO group peptidase (beta-lactamase class C family)
MIELSHRRRPSIGRMLGSVAAAFGLFFALPLLAAVAGPVRAASGGPDFAAIDRYVQAEMDDQRIPGLALGIVHGGRIVHLRGFGEADPSGRAVTPDTPFFIGSVTKSFTALAIMQLKEAGEVDLDAPVQRYLPWWHVADAADSARVTLRDLLYQVSGFSKATGNAYATSGDSADSALEDRVRALGSVDLTEPVGTVWQYSNANYWTLGMIVQAVSGESYETYVEQHIFAPLEMHDSFTSQTEAEADGLVTGYRYWFGFPFAADVPFDRGGLGAGGLSSSVADIARYLSAYVNDGRYGGTQLVSAAGMAELQRPGVPIGRDDVSYAMGWEVSESNGIPTVSHDGSGFNAHANVVLVPGSRWGVVLLENAENSPDEFFGARQMTAIAFGVTSMVMGKEPLPVGSSVALWVVYGIVFAVIAIQITGITRSVRTFRKWRTDPQRRPRGPARIGLFLGLPLALNCIWAFIVLVAMPRKVGAPLSALLMGLPDLAYPLVGSAIVALGWGVGRTIWAVLILRSPRRLPIIDEPISQEPIST